MTKLDRLILEYLGQAEKPLWGGHLKRGEPLRDQTMQRWLKQGLIEAVDGKGYILTDAGRAAINP